MFDLIHIFGKSWATLMIEGLLGSEAEQPWNPSTDPGRRSECML